MGFFKEKEMELEQQEMTDAESDKDNVADIPKRLPFQVWQVGSDTYRLKLGTAEISELEMKFKTNLMNIMGTGQGGMPALSVMLDVAHAAMKRFHHGIKRADVNAMFDQYVDEGGSQLDFYMEVYMGIFKVSGFFSNSLAGQMEEALEGAKEFL